MPKCSSHRPAPRPAEGAGYQTCSIYAIAHDRLTPGQRTARPLRARLAYGGLYLNELLWLQSLHLFWRWHCGLCLLAQRL